MPDYDLKNRIKLIELLKKHTDKEHPLSQAKLRRDVKGADSVMGYKNSFTRRLFDIAEAYNTDESGNLLDEKDWKIVYPGYKKRRMGLETSGARNGKIYYNHIFTRTELDFLIQQIRETDNFTDKEKEIFEEKIIQELASAKYIPLKDNEISPSLIHNFENKDYAFIRRNIKILREAIEKNYMVEFKMLKMNKEKQIEFAKEEEYIISPYILLYYNGDYWLLANCQRERLYNEEYNYKFSSGVTLYRVDKMSRVSFFEQDYKKKKRRFPYHTERKLEEWNDRVCFLHKGEFAKGSRFEPIPEIAFEILWDKFPKKERNDYSFIYDSFGKNFEVKNNVVYVKASPEFFERWAMGYADRIIVTEDTPASVIVRENLKIKIKEIHSLYN